MTSGRVMRMTWRSGLIGLVAWGASLGGCAPQKTVDDQRTTIRSLEDQLAQRRQETSEYEQTIEEKNELLADARQTERELRGEVESVLDQNQQLEQRVQTLEQRNKQTVQDFEQILNEMDQTVLDPETDRALARLASEHPDLVSYDSERGMLRFASDLTFDSGSAVVRDDARAGLRQLAEVLQGIAAAYEVEVVGHTDSQQISSSTAQKHPTNVHLSAHRAIAVRDVLASAGVPEDRMKASGWGAQRPRVPNNESGGTRKNRRVEVFLTRAGDAEEARAEVQTNNEGSVEIDRAEPPSEPIDTTK